MIPEFANASSAGIAFPFGTQRWVTFRSHPWKWRVFISTIDGSFSSQPCLITRGYPTLLTPTRWWRVFVTCPFLFFWFCWQPTKTFPRTQVSWATPQILKINSVGTSCATWWGQFWRVVFVFFFNLSLAFWWRILVDAISSYTLLVMTSIAIDNCHL